MIVIYALLGISGALFLWVLAEIAIALTKRPIPDLPIVRRDSSGLTMLYRLFSNPGSVPENTVIDEKFIDEALEPSIEYISARYDCADFRLLFLLRLYLEFKHLLPASNAKTIKDAVTGFKYWMDEPGSDSMCYWSENHQMMFAVCEYLAGMEWPGEVFPNAGMTGEEHRKKALERINIWLEQRFHYGFSEWYSNNYYPEDIAPMSAFIEFADEKETAERMKIVFDLLWFDVATHSVNNTFVASSSRMYANNKSSDKNGNSIKDEMKVIWGGANTETLAAAAGESGFNINGVEFKLKLCGQMSNHFAKMVERGFYQVPDIIKKIGEDKARAVIKSSSGLSVEDMENEKLIGQNVNQIMAQLGAETFTNHQVIGNTLDYISRTKMYRNIFVNPFKYLDIKLLRMMKIPEFLSKHLPLMTNGIALSRGNVYFYRTPYYSLSTAVAQNVDTCGAQGHIWTANIAPDLTLYTTQPARDDKNDAKHKESPGYWVGNGRQPMSVQDESINITLYKIPKRKRPAEFRIADISHAYVPKTRYDRLEINNNLIFGQKGKVLVAMIANGKLEYRPYEQKGAEALRYEKPADSPEDGTGCEFDLVRHGGEYHSYITELSDTDTENFESFKARITKNAVRSVDGKVEYTSKGKTYSVGYDKTFLIDGQPQPLTYERFDSRYSLTERKAGQIIIEYEGEKLLLDLKNRKREVIKN